MGSYDLGKDYICNQIRNNYHISASILDVGACDGKWRELLPEYPNMDAVEAFGKNAAKLIYNGKYRNVFQADIRDFQYEWYDLIIFGDVIEHLSVAQAQRVLNYAKPRCKDMIIAVPFMYEQEEIYGNPYEVHLQPDLTMDNFKERFPGFDVMLKPADFYCYYHKGANNGAI